MEQANLSPLIHPTGMHPVTHRVKSYDGALSLTAGPPGYLFLHSPQFRRPRGVRRHADGAMGAEGKSISSD